MTTDHPQSPDGAAAARAWVEHVRGGGTTPWRRWLRDAGVDGDPRTPTGPMSLPGAAQLELLRRLNAAGPAPHLADRVLTRPGPGRGPVHLRLPLHPPGPPAPRREVLRVATGVLADLVAELPPHRPARRRRRPAAAADVPAFVVDGLPVTAVEVRARLSSMGLVEHRPRPPWRGGRKDAGPEIAVVLAGPLDEALRQAWSSRVQRGATRSWPRFVTHWSGRGTLPPSAAVDRTVDYWASRLGAGNVHLVTVDPASDPLAQVTRLLGRSDAPLSGAEPAVDDPAADPLPLPPAVVDALRRVNVVLPFVCAADQCAPRRTALLGLLSGTGGQTEPAALPEKRRRWAGSTAGRLVDALEGSGCRVHGELSVLRTVTPATGRRIGPEEVLESMVGMIHRVDQALGAAAGSRTRSRTGRRRPDGRGRR